MTERPLALVTGAAGGIGAALCRALAAEGAAVVACGRRLEPLEELVDELASEGAEAIALSLDVTRPESVAQVVGEIGRRLGPVRWLLNNAGVARSAPLLRAAEQGLYELHMDVNFHGARRLGEALLPGMLESGGGAIAQIASSAGLVGYPYVAAYVASKHALLGYSRSAALELRGKGVAVNAVCPHYVDSPMTEESVENIAKTTGRSREEAREFLASQNPGGQFVQPSEVASCALELCRSARSGVVTELLGGSSREVEAGFTLEQGTR